MSELSPASDRHWLVLHRGVRPESAAPTAPTRLDCEGCPVAAGEIPDANCAECVVSVFLSAEPWREDGA